MKPGFAEARQQPAAFANPAPGTFGHLGRNTFRAPPISAVDLALSKNLAVTEGFRIDTPDSWKAMWSGPGAIPAYCSSVETSSGVVLPAASS